MHDVQVPILAKADSMTVEELREFRRSVRQTLEEVKFLLAPQLVRHTPIAQCAGMQICASLVFNTMLGSWREVPEACEKILLCMNMEIVNPFSLV